MTWVVGSDHRALRAPSGAPFDLVELLDVSRRSGKRSFELRRMARAGTLPPPHYRFHSLAVWHWPTLVASRAAEGNRATAEHPVPPEADLVSLGDIADRLSIPRSELRSLLRSGEFPRPDYQFSKGDAWLWTTAQTWHDQQGPLAMVRRELRRVESEHLAAWEQLLGRTERSATGNEPAGHILDEFDALSGRLERLAAVFRETLEPGQTGPGTIVPRG